MKIFLFTFLSVVFIINTTFSQFSFDVDLIAHYPLDGDTKDYSGYNNNGINVGATLTSDRFGNSNSAYYFDGNDYIKVPENSILNPADNMTICVWFKTQSFCGTGNNVIISKGYTSFVYPHYQYHIGINGNTGSCSPLFRTDVTINGVRETISTPSNYWSSNKWYFLTMSFGNDTLKFYVDGKLISSKRKMGEVKNYKKDLYIGAFGHKPSNGTPGTIDDIRMYKRALTQKEIKEIYNSKGKLKIKYPCASNYDSCLLAHYPFNGNTNDTGMYSNHGVNNGAKLTYDRFGNKDYAYEFDGNAYIRIPNDSSLNPENSISLCAWFKTKPFKGTGNNVILSKGYTSFNAPYYQYHLGVNINENTKRSTSGVDDGSNTDKSLFRTDIAINDKRYIASTTNSSWSPDTNVWYFITSTFDNEYIRLYVDGKIIDSVEASGNINNYKQDLFIGSFGHNPSNGTKGVIDDIRIYSCALESWQINELFDEESPVSSTYEKVANDISIYPNPTNSVVNIKLHYKSNCDYQLLNSIGQIVKSGQLIENRIDLSEFKSGLYFLKITSSYDNVNEIFRVIKQ